MNKTGTQLTKDTAQIIKKWYSLLDFPKEFDREFEEALESIEIPADTTIESYDFECTDGRLNLLSMLYLCEELERKYQSLGLDQEVLLSSLHDVVVYTKVWTEVKGELYLGELGWLKRHFTVKIFELGRLQFATVNSRFDIPEFNIHIGDPVLEIHIPRGKSLDYAECDESFAKARKFFEKHFPDFKYKAFICSSWLLDDTLKKHLRENSNILAFAKRFTKISSVEAYSLLRFLFRWDTTIENLRNFTPKTSFAASIKDAVLAGEKFYATLGVIPR